MNTNSDELYNFIKSRSSLVWDTQNYRGLSEKAITEAVLNYGTWCDFQNLIKILGITKVASLFKEGVNQSRSNYRPEIKHYFTLYFEKHA